jgi:hypothetical protein
LPGNRGHDLVISVVAQQDEALTFGCRRDEQIDGSGRAVSACLGEITPEVS